MVENLKDELFSQFTKLDILSREDLRERVDEIKIEGLNQQIIEGFYAEYRKGIRNSGQVCTPTIKVIVVGDLHIPYHNKVMVTKLLELLRIEQPDQIILNGDMVDFYDLSRFDKNPEREGRLQEELDICVDLLKSLRKTCKDARIIYIEGNHEDRLKRYLWSKAKALSSLRALKFEELLKFDKYKIEFMKSHFINGFEFNHGKIVRKHSSYSAKCEYDDRGHSGISNHTHRGGSYYKTISDGTFGWFENFCGCELNPEYIEGTPNWQNGFSVIYFDDNAFDVHQVYVNRGRFRFNGTRY